MEQRLKILYKDESGNLKARGRICDIYVYNDGWSFNPQFWVISRNKKIILSLPLLFRDINGDKTGRCVYTDYFSKRSIYVYDQDILQIYNYITDNYDDNGKSIWFNMISSYNYYFNIKNTVNDSTLMVNNIQDIMLKSKLYNDDKRNIDISSVYFKYNEIGYEYLGKRLGMCQLSVSYQFPLHPVLVIHSHNTKFYGMVSMITGKYFGGDELNTQECCFITNFMHQDQPFHYPYDKSIWAYLMLDYIMFNLSLPDDTIQYVYNNINDISLIPVFDHTSKFNDITTLIQICKGEI